MYWGRHLYSPFDIIEWGWLGHRLFATPAAMPPANFFNETEKTKEEAKMYMIPGDIRYQAAVLLANMALHTRKEAISS